MPTTASISPVDLGLAALEQARGYTLGLAEDVAEDKLLHRLAPGGNHAMYILGHLAWADDAFRCGLGGQDPVAPELTKELFGYGITLSDDPSDYPSPSVVMDRLAATRKATIEWFSGMDEEQLRTPLPEDFQSFAPTFASLMCSMAWHEGVHAGQLTAVRKSLGMPARFA